MLRDKIQCQIIQKDPEYQSRIVRRFGDVYDSLGTILKPNRIAQYDKQNKNHIKDHSGRKYKRVDKRSPVFRRGKHGNHRFGFGTSHSM